MSPGPDEVPAGLPASGGAGEIAEGGAEAGRSRFQRTLTAAFHDHEGSSTASRTRSFMIIEIPYENAASTMITKALLLPAVVNPSGS